MLSKVRYRFEEEREGPKHDAGPSWLIIQVRNRKMEVASVFSILIKFFILRWISSPISMNMVMVGQTTLELGSCIFFVWISFHHCFNVWQSFLGYKWLRKQGQDLKISGKTISSFHLMNERTSVQRMSHEC